MQRDHVDGRSHGNPFIDRGQQKYLRASTGRARCTDAVAAHVRQRLDKVERTNAVPQLKTGHAETPQTFARAAERSVFELTAVVVAGHVVREHDESLTRE